MDPCPDWSTYFPFIRTGDTSAELQRAWLALYASHALSTWCQRMWEFAIGLLMLEFRPNSLLLVSVFGMVDSGVQVLVGGAVGTYIGRCMQGLLFLPEIFQEFYLF